MIINRRDNQTLVIDVNLLAPVRSGSEIAILQIANEQAGFFEHGGPHELVLDIDANILYGDDNYYNQLEKAPVHDPIQDPVGFLGVGWQTKRSFRGRCLRAVVCAAEGGDHNKIRTRIFLASETAAGYR